MAGLTLDTGALIGFERADRRVLTLENAELQGLSLTIPTAVIAEAWRGGRRVTNRAIDRASVVEPLFEDVARAAGEAAGAVKGCGVVDAIVVASAVSRGDRVLTSDWNDLDQLRAHFPEVRLLSV